MNPERADTVVAAEHREADFIPESVGHPCPAKVEADPRSFDPAWGSAELHVGRVRGRSAALRSRSRSPLCLLVPRQGESVWAYLSSLGGGMVAGDQVRVEIDLDAQARCFFSTQSASKIFRNPRHRPCAQELHARIASDALLALVPDPVQCFAEAQYEQRQRFVLELGANLLFVDWLSAGRAARGERWLFRRYNSRNEVIRDGRPVLWDAIDLEGASMPLDHRYRVGSFGCLATLVLLGPLLEPFAKGVLESVALAPFHAQSGLAVSASPLQEGAIVRLGAHSVEDAGRALHRWLSFLSTLLDDDPLARKF